MQTTLNDTFSLWRAEGAGLIPQNFQTFHDFLSRASSLAKSGEYNAAATYAQIAANHAQVNHCGFYVSPELDRLLLEIGRKTISTDLDYRDRGADPANTQHVLHVSTHVRNIGGISRLLWRWIQQDTNRTHSVALTRQGSQEIPQQLRDAVLDRQGQIYILNDGIDGITEIAKRLHQCAETADVVVLHTWEYDVVPTIAFANRAQSPPIIYTNNGDQLFWVGASVSDVVANLRESGQQLSLTRRGIEPARNMLLPIILEPACRILTQSEAKRQLDIDENQIVLLSIARAEKYRTIDGVNFAQAHVELLKKYSQCILIVVGAGDSNEDWSTAIEATAGRIRVLGQTKDTAVYYQAADIYVDSFPFVSNTSLLEAGSFGIPLVSRYPYPSDACQILGADMPGLTGNLIRATDLEQYTAVLSDLVEDEAGRHSRGAATRSAIEQNHWGEDWQHRLEDVYYRAVSLPRVKMGSGSATEMILDEPDVFLPSVNGVENRQVLHWHLPLLPLKHRLYWWLMLVKKYGLRHNPPNLLIAEGLRSRYYNLRSSLKSLISN